MRALISLILLISVVSGGAVQSQGEREISVSRSVWYWHQKLPMTPIPPPVRDLISGGEDGKIALNVEKAWPRRGAVPLRGCDAAIIYGANTQMSSESSPCTFVLEKDLVSGSKVSLTFPRLRESESHFLPRSVANEIPFSSEKLPVVLKELNIAPDSVMARAMKQTLEACERPAAKGETKFCATSLESLIDYVTAKLGSNSVTVLATSVSTETSESVVPRQQYTITGVKYEGKEDKAVYYCHNAQYPYSMYYCHEAPGTRTVRVWGKGEEDGSMVEAVAVCHSDTSIWSPNNIAFQILSVNPGTPYICHFAPQGDLVWQTAD